MTILTHEVSIEKKSHLPRAQAEPHVFLKSHGLLCIGFLFQYIKSSQTQQLKTTPIYLSAHSLLGKKSVASVAGGSTPGLMGLKPKYRMPHSFLEVLGKLLPAGSFRLLDK